MEPTSIAAASSSSSSARGIDAEYRSPTAIPPRTSSSAGNRLSFGSTNIAATAPTQAQTQASGKQVLKPLSEGNWMASTSASTSGSGSGSASPPTHTARRSSGISHQYHHSPAAAGPSASALASASASGPRISAALPAEMSSSSHPNAPLSSSGIISPTSTFLRGTTTTSNNAVGAVPTASASSSWTADKEKLVLGPYDYLSARPGKDIRKSMIAAFNRWLRVPEERLEIINKVVGMLHTASLLIDDIEDSSYLRRGIPVAHHIFGTAQTLNSANYVYFQALQELARLANPRFTEIYAEELLNLHRGQGLDLYWRDTLTCPSESDYVEMVGNKTGGLFRLAVKLMMAESQVQKDFSSLVTLIGVIFQIRDDYLNLCHANYTNNKGLCEDLTEGKFSFPIIHAIRADPHNRQLINILKQKPTEDAVKKYAVEYMESMGSFAYCRKVVSELIQTALSMIAELESGGASGDGDAVKEIVSKMALD